jgi:type I restriction enzyme, S subunit
MTQRILEIFGDVAVCTRAATELRKGAFRLDASFYSEENRAAIESVVESGLPTEALSDIAEVFCSGVRERTFVRKGTGHALLTGSDLDTTNTEDFRYVSKAFTRNYSTERLIRGDVLISSAGTVGKCDFVWDNHEDRLASQDIIRIRAQNGKVRHGYLYALFSGTLGKAFLTNQSAGSVIVRLYIENLDTLRVPRVADAAEERISKTIIASFEARAASRKLLISAKEKMILANRLEPLPADQDEDPVCFNVAQSGLAVDEMRLESRFYNPIALAAIANLQKSPCLKQTVGELSHNVIMSRRFTRNFVAPTYGVPFLSGKCIVQIRPTDLKHLSNSETENLNDLLVKRGWILISRSGTIGRTCFVWHNFENYASSEDLLRVLPDNAKIDPGYLNAFLSSEYGYEQIIRFRYGSVIDHVTDQQLKKAIIAVPSPVQQKEIGDFVRLAYEKRADALRLEDEAQEMLMREIRGKTGKES